MRLVNSATLNYFDLHEPNLKYRTNILSIRVDIIELTQFRARWVEARQADWPTVRLDRDRMMRIQQCQRNETLGVANESLSTLLHFIRYGCSPAL